MWVETIKDSFRIDLEKGLNQKQKSIPSKYFYDKIGSVLFQKIMALPEYYLTRCELEIIQTHKDKIAELVDNESINLVELGVGDGQKTRFLINSFLYEKKKINYTAIDISKAAIHSITSLFGSRFPNIKTQGLHAEYFHGLKWLKENSDKRKLVLFLGSNIGNFTHNEQLLFLQYLRNYLRKDDLLFIGFDLIKDEDILIKAYDDSLGITSDFNLNMLQRINRELGGNFDINKWQHSPRFNKVLGAMESFLESTEAQEVYIEDLDQSFVFQKGEKIYTECSVKFNLERINQLAIESGFLIKENFFDKKRYFVDSLWKAY